MENMGWEFREVDLQHGQFLGFRIELEKLVLDSLAADLIDPRLPRAKGPCYFFELVNLTYQLVNFLESLAARVQPRGRGAQVGQMGGHLGPEMKVDGALAQEKAIWIEQVDGRARHDALGDRTVHVVDGDSEDGERRQVTVPERDAYYLVEL